MTSPDTTGNIFVNGNAAGITYRARVSNDAGAHYVLRERDDAAAVAARSPQDEVVAWGDSITQGITSTMSYPYLLSALLPHRRPAINMGIAGQTTRMIQARAGGEAVTFTVAGGSLSAAGDFAALTLADGSVDLLRSDVVRSLRGTLAGRPGVLKRDPPLDGGAYYFFPDPAATATAAAGSVPFVPDADAYRRMCNIIWSGRNDDLTTSAGRDVVAARIGTMVGRLQWPREFLVIGVLNATTEALGTSQCEGIKAHNASMAAAYGVRFLDPRAVLCVNADGSARADGTPNPAWMYDPVHPNDAGQWRLAQAIAAKAATFGWQQ
ncbi:hypothetical protein DEIGR_100850 [Deinococcus grandis]|uniref:SGNH hydrolase-type esterase domain-containing protein n=2 Tax=Deinococcus grandis TaxID=57498 RepID=A0A100HHG1_9DEIO|nr:hypothetical protein DEIGR_100850 [Deinococcus grandis]